ncbi:MAG: hypothetical protein DWQ47_15965 [Acidobacteria bacterium]|nr:MAG: hypothetical protein DWQ32_03365 [Acidobacteriota bacterium]REK02448.1 MAG: hypothetical protein DWQ38_08770 [Acidobacteriota bacterium]REK13750.1 MAG: hypothetical protein DWQ43_09055 [Acidobacteriota bacterium]REK41744.1 MAG: hypothetical protein DWQ47_15965 [Acidobacteriota bacterium]
MRPKLLAVFLICSAIVPASCGGSASDPNGTDGNSSTNEFSNGNDINGPRILNLNAENGEIAPGIPANGNQAVNIPKGATPTPGIPDEETLRRQMRGTNTDPNVVNRPARTVPESNSKPNDPLGRPRKTNSN